MGRKLCISLFKTQKNHSKQQITHIRIHSKNNKKNRNSNDVRMPSEANQWIMTFTRKGHVIIHQIRVCLFHIDRNKNQKLKTYFMPSYTFEHITPPTLKYIQNNYVCFFFKSKFSTAIAQSKKKLISIDFFQNRQIDHLTFLKPEN